MADRKVRFLRATDGDLRLMTGGFPAARVLELIDEMVAHGTAEVPIGQGDRLVAKSLGQQANGLHVVLYRVSSEDLPMLYEHGQFRPLADVIAEGADIAEPAHFAFFDDDVVANLYNHKGPKQLQLASYLNSTMDLDCLFEPIVRSDVLESIAQAGGVQLFNLRMRVDELNRLEGLPLNGMAVLSQDMPIGDVEIIVRATTPDQKRALADVMSPLAAALRTPARRRAIKKAKIALKDTDELSEGRLVDILDDVITLSHQVATVPGQRRYVEEGSAMLAIEDAYLKVVHLL